jgi:16S rRNA (guanine966-N2)-methyltransferase
MAAPGLRIISGAWGGRRIHAPPGLDTRPLTDRIKQSLFDWLGQTMDGWRVADCCAGSGAFGIECVSRGAAEAHLCEPGRPAIATIRANLALLGDPPEVRLHPRGFERVLPTLGGLDLVFCDPPFPWFAEQRDLLAEMLQLAAAAASADGIVLIRGERGEELPEHALRECERREYGRSWVAMLRRNGGLLPAPEPDAG